MTWEASCSTTEDCIFHLSSACSTADSIVSTYKPDLNIQYFISSIHVLVKYQIVKFSANNIIYTSLSPICFIIFYTSINSLLLLLSQVLANIGASYNSFISIIFLTWLNHLSPKTTHHFIWCICTWIHYGRQVLRVWYQKRVRMRSERKWQKHNEWSTHLLTNYIFPNVLLVKTP